MIESIYTGITGVQSHQTRMNVIGNNIANVNTSGFKSARVTFADVMGRTLSEGAAARDGVAPTNPRQAGLGVRVSSIDLDMSQGSSQNTGIDTDLSIEGDGFFVVSDGQTTSYTRDGSFLFDKTGKLIDPGTGLVVQGNLSQDDGTFKSETENLVIPLDRESKAQATTAIHLSGNLDVSGDGQGEPVWSTDTSFGLPASLAGNASLDFTAFTSGAGLKVTIGKGGQITESTLSVPPRTFPDRLALVAELNAQINVNGTLQGKVLFKADDLGQIILRTTEGGEKIELSVDNADPNANVVAALGLAPQARTAGLNASDTSLLNDLANVGQHLTSGDVLRFSGTKPSGERFDGIFTFTEGTNDTLDDLLQVVASAYGGVRAGLDTDTGKLILTNEISGDRVVGFDLNLSLLDTGNGSGIFGDNPPFSYSTNTQIYDNKGDVHSLTVNFIKGTVANEWTWVATVDGLNPQAGNNGKAVFHEDGTLRTFQSSDKSALVFENSGGTPALRVDIAAGGTERLGGLTQVVAPSSVSVRDQDGHASGRLIEVNIEDDGNIRGLFSNGESQVLGRVLLASFTNPEGLKRGGANLFTQTEASGQPVVGAAGSTVSGRVRAGSLEMSNVDLADEFVSMMVTQRGFQASARSITTSDELLSELVNLKR
ncbi:MAG: flagellar hook-basal body complex protein [Candidatus Handelsmanbacteria bacterium]|nr:flagellar hook-basal body complex protein [Candidatus Handelsmanbacteria bacterium]